VFLERESNDPVPDDVRGEGVVILHTAVRLGMSVMGLAYFSRERFERAHPRARVTSVALVESAPADLAELFDELRPEVDYRVVTSC
jgi:hypothetical protein